MHFTFSAIILWKESKITMKFRRKIGRIGKRHRKLLRSQKNCAQGAIEKQLSVLTKLSLDIGRTNYKNNFRTYLQWWSNCFSFRGMYRLRSPSNMSFWAHLSACLREIEQSLRWPKRWGFVRRTWMRSLFLIVLTWDHWEVERNEKNNWKTGQIHVGFVENS